MHCVRIGKRNHILRFKSEPLRWGVRITSGQEGEPFLWLHSERMSGRVRAREPRELQLVAQWVMQQRDGLMRRRHAMFRPPRRQMGDEALLAILSGASSTKCEMFEEAERAVRRGRLLSACAELFAPFGMQPVIPPATGNVEFRTKFLRTGPCFRSSKLGPVSEPIVWIERAGKYVGETDGEVMDGSVGVPLHDQPAWLSTSVVLVGTFFNTTFQTGDDTRKFALWLENSGLKAHIPTNNAPLPEALVYNLASPNDRHALVKRVLSAQDEKKEANEQASGREKWLGKMNTAWHKENPRLEKRKQARARRTPLRTETLPELLDGVDLDAVRERSNKKLEKLAAEERRRRWCPDLEEYWATGQLGRYVAVKQYLHQRDMDLDVDLEEEGSDGDDGDDSDDDDADDEDVEMMTSRMISGPVDHRQSNQMRWTSMQSNQWRVSVPYHGRLCTKRRRY